MTNSVAAPAGHLVPSQQPVELYEVLIDTVGSEDWLRFRFIAPTIGKGDGKRSFADVEADMAHLCATVAQPYMQEHGLRAEVVAITLLDRPVAFGQVDPEATQYIDVFRVSTGTGVGEGL